MPTRRVREPVQVYLDQDEKALLVRLAQRTSLSQAEILRRGLRRISADLLEGSRRGGSLEVLIGSLGEELGVPPDLAGRHDDYLYPEECVGGESGG